MSLSPSCTAPSLPSSTTAAGFDEPPGEKHNENNPHPLAWRLYYQPVVVFGVNYTLAEEELLEDGGSLDDYSLPWSPQQEFFFMPWGLEPVDFLQKLTLRMVYPLALRGQIAKGRACYSLTVGGIRYYYSSSVLLDKDPTDASMLRPDDVWFEGVVLDEQNPDLVLACSCLHHIESVTPAEPIDGQQRNGRLGRVEKHPPIPADTPLIQCSCCKTWHHQICLFPPVSPNGWKCRRTYGCRILSPVAFNRHSSLRPCSRQQLSPVSTSQITSIQARNT